MWSLVLGLLVVPPPAAAEEDIQALVARVESHYSAVEAFEADFTQRYERRILRTSAEESGKVSVRKPGRMRWEYKTPEEKLFVTDGSRSYFYIPVEKQVIVSHQPTGAMGMERGSPFELLAGRARLTDSFECFPSESDATRGGVVLHLVPKSRHEEFENVELEVAPESGRILRVALLDIQGNRTEFIFENLRENVELPDSLFRFSIPTGVEVVVHGDEPPNP